MTIENIIFEYDSYFKNHQKRIICNETISFNTIGYKNERNDYYDKLNYYNIINSNFESFKREIKIHIFSIMSYLRLKCTYFLFNKIYSNILKTYKIIKNFSKLNHLKNRLNITLICIYYVCKSNYIFINLSKLMNHYDISIKIKNILVKSYFLINKDIIISLKKDNFRIKFISNILINYINLDKFYLYLINNWNILKKTKDTVIIITILNLFKIYKRNKKISNRQISVILGITLSSSNNFIKTNNLII